MWFNKLNVKRVDWKSHFEKWLWKVYLLEYTYMSLIIIHMYIYTYLVIIFRNFIDDVGSEIDKTRQKFGIMNAQQSELPPGELNV